MRQFFNSLTSTLLTKSQLVIFALSHWLVGFLRFVLLSLALYLSARLSVISFVVMSPFYFYFFCKRNFRTLLVFILDFLAKLRALFSRVCLWAIKALLLIIRSWRLAFLAAIIIHLIIHTIEGYLSSITPLDRCNYCMRFRNRFDFFYRDLYPTFFEIFQFWHDRQLDALDAVLPPEQRTSKGIDHKIWTSDTPRRDRRRDMWAKGYRPWGRDPCSVWVDIEKGHLTFCDWAMATLPRWLIGLWTLIFWWHKPYW